MTHLQDSEFQLQSELDQAGKVNRVGHLAEGGTGEGSVRRPELRVVEEIEQLRPELDPHSFVDGGPLEHGEVEVDYTLLPDRGINPRLVTEGPRAWGRETGCVEPFRHLVHRTSGNGLVASRSVVGSQPANAKAGSREAVTAASVELYRETTLQGGNTVQAPAGDHSAGKSVKTGQILLAMPKGEIKDVADDQALRYVLGRQRTLSLQIVPILYPAYTARGAPFQP